MFDKENLNINMDAKGYIEYLKYKKSKRHSLFNGKLDKLWAKKTKDQKLAVGLIFMSCLGIVLLAILIQIFFFPTPEYISNTPFLMSLSWGQLIKYGLIVSFPFIVFAWVVHGVQLRLFA